MKAPPAYAELSCQSAFSFLRGACEPEVLVQRAVELGYRALALTDRDGLYGSPRFHLAAKQAGLPGVHGTTLTLRSAPASRGQRYDGTPTHADDRVVLLAQDEAGWGALCRVVSAARHRDRRAPWTSPSDLGGGVGGHTSPEASAGLLCLAGSHLSTETLEVLRDIFGPERLALSIHDRMLRRDRRGQQVQRQRAARYGLPLVVTGGVRLARPEDKPLHDVLTCVRHKQPLDRAGPLLLPNAEFHLRPREVLARLFRHCPEALAHSVTLAERCTWSLDALAYRFPPFEVPEGETTFSYLHDLVHAGARRRYRPLRAAEARQLAKELDVIEGLDLAGYFLVMHDIVRFCEEQSILCQGRGSAANSAVCYALGITSVDPVGMDLLFERFLSEERGELPDIDLDIAHQDRERVLRYVYSKYGRDHAAMVAEVITYRARSALRDAGKALGFTPAELDDFAHNEAQNEDKNEGDPGDSSAGSDSREALLRRCVRALIGLPRHLSIHVGGFVISGPPLHDCLPTEPAAMAGRTVVPWDKDDMAQLGIIKIDLLGLGMLTVLDRCLASVSATRLEAGQSPLALHTVPADDEPTWDMLCAADTVGVFQVESRAQMNCLPRLRPRCFYDLVVEVALIRPGPIQGDMVHPYLRRRAGTEAVTYPHPRLEPILRRTLGIPLFQEQGMKIAVAAADFRPGEADELRRAMGHKRSRQRMDEMSERLIGGMVKNGIAREVALRIQHQLTAFADYGFPESHAASFARLVWVSAWLKRHYPAHFLCAMLNAQPMGFYPTATLISDARRHGVLVAPVDALQSDWDSSLQWIEGNGAGHGPSEEQMPDAQPAAEARQPVHQPVHQPVLGVRLGLCSVRGVGERHEAGVRAGLASVELVGPFVDPQDFARRTGLDRRQMEHLARLGALGGFEQRRRHALWLVAQMARRTPGPLADRLPFEADVALPAMSAAEVVREDYAMGGASVDRHPLELLRAELEAQGVLPARSLGGVAAGFRPTVKHGQAIAVAGMVICRQRPHTAGGLVFVTLEDETGFANVIISQKLAARDSEGLRATLLLVEGRVERSQSVVNIQARALHALDGGRPLPGLLSHDYH